MTKVPKVVLFLENSRQYGRDLIRGISGYSRLHGPWTFFKEDTFYSPTGHKAKDYCSWIKKWGADGIITRDFDGIEEMIGTGIPIVISVAFLEPIKGAININVDHNLVSDFAFDHFLGRGFTNFAYCGFEDMPWSKRRQENFTRIVKQAGYDIKVYNSKSSRIRNWDQEYPQINKWLKSLVKPVGVLCCNDDRGCDLIEACKTGGIRVPFEVAVLGVDNDTQVCELSNPPLSSIELSTEKAGYEAASVLDRLMSGKQAGTTNITVLPLRTISRQSTDTLAINDDVMVTALQFIYKNSRRLVQVSDVTDFLDCSRRGLDKKFLRYLGHTVFTEIKRVRIDNIIRLMVETDLSISQIALNLGYNDSDHIARFFRQEKGVTPHTFRKKYGFREMVERAD